MSLFLFFLHLSLGRTRSHYRVLICDFVIPQNDLASLFISVAIKGRKKKSSDKWEFVETDLTFFFFFPLLARLRRSFHTLQNEISQ